LIDPDKKIKLAEKQIDLLYKANEMGLSNSERLDKAILTLSSAALGLIFYFYKENISGSNFIKGSLIFFVLAIVSTILSFHFSQGGLKVISAGISRDIEDLMANRPVTMKRFLPWQNSAVKVCNFVSSGAFILGVVLMMVMAMSANVK
jgi:hypothetical protein